MSQPILRSECRGCGAPIIWLHAEGRTVAVEAEPHAGGTIFVEQTGTWHRRHRGSCHYEWPPR